MIEIRSYRRVFDLERRIYSVDRVRLNPGGVPVRGVVYFLAIALAGLTVVGVPAIGAPLRELPWYLRDVALPGAGATVLSAIRIEGRVFHLAARALLRYSVGPRRLAAGRRCRNIGGRWHPREIVLLPDGSDSRMRRMRYTGPGAVLVSVKHEPLSTGRRRPALTLREPPARGMLDRAQVIALARGARLAIRSSAPPERVSR